MQIAAVGWDYEHWHNDFYPHDLPSDWRLAYYANEFREVLVPEFTWFKEPFPDLRQWYEDTPVEFRFYILVTTALLYRLDWSTIRQCLSSLGEKLGGVVMDRRSDALGQFAMTLSAVCPDTEIFEDAGDIVEGYLRQWRSANGSVVGWLKCSPKIDLRTLRTDLERFAENLDVEECVIFIEGDIKALHDATVIVRLLGH